MRKSNFLIAIISLAILIVAGCEDPELGIIETGIIGADSDSFDRVSVFISQGGDSVYADTDILISSDFHVIIVRELAPDTGYAVTVTAYNENDSTLFEDSVTGITLSAGDERVVNFLIQMGSFAPTNLTASAISESEIDLAWVDNSVDEDGFVISRKTGTAFFAPYDTVAENVTSFSDAGLLESKEYTYRVFAYNYVGNSGFSNPASATTMATIPADPSNTWAVYDENITVKWKDNANNEDGFKVMRKSLSSGIFEEIGTNLANDTVFVDESTDLVETYTYKVSAYNSRGESGYSAEAKTTTISMIGSLDIEGSSASLQIVGNYAYVTNSYGLQIIDISDPQNPVFSSLIEYTYCVDIAVSSDGQYAYFTNFSYSNPEAGLHIYDLTDPANPDSIATLNIFAAVAVDLSDDNNHAYVTSYNVGEGAMHVVDISTPAAPAMLGTVSLGLGQPTDLEFDDYTCYIACGIEGMWVIDVDDPANPDSVGIYLGLPIAWGVCVDENFLYLSGGFSINILNVSSPAAPANVGVYNAPLNARDVKLYGDRLFVPDMNAGEFFIADVTNRAVPKTLGKTTISSVNSQPARVIVNEPYAYVVDVTGIRILFVGHY